MRRLVLFMTVKNKCSSFLLILMHCQFRHSFSSASSAPLQLGLHVTPPPLVHTDRAHDLMTEISSSPPPAAASAVAASAAASKAKASTGSASSDASSRPQVTLLLSRPRYRPGSAVVGAVTLSYPPRAAADHHSRSTDAGGSTPLLSIEDLKRRFHSVKLYLSGHARIDPRWHSTQALAELYGQHPLLTERHLPRGVEEKAVRHIFGDCADGVHVEGGRTVCFYATNVVDLVGDACQLKDRPLFDGDDDGGRGCSSILFDRDGNDDEQSQHEQSQNEQHQQQHHQQQKLAFTFRSELPDDAPPSVTTASARYFYSAVLCIETGPYEDDETLIYQAPFAVIHSPPPHRPGSGSGTCGSGAPAHAGFHKQSSKAAAGGGRVKIGTLIAVSHPNSLPCYVSATERNQLSKLSVDRDFGLVSSRSAGASDVRSVRVTDQHGRPCCLLTLIGTERMRPGGRAEVRCDCSEDVVLRNAAAAGAVNGNGTPSSSPALLPCYRVSVLLRGEELALNEDGTEQRTRSYNFDCRHAFVEPGCTDSVTVGVSLPLDCPITMRTDLVRVSATCTVVLTVQKYPTEEEDGDNASIAAASSGGSGIKFDFLTLEMPCEVLHNLSNDDDENEGDSMEDEGGYATHLLGYGWSKDHQGDGETSWRGSFVAEDIMHDLKMLSMHLIDQSNQQ